MDKNYRTGVCCGSCKYCVDAGVDEESYDCRHPDVGGDGHKVIVFVDGSMVCDLWEMG